MASTAWANERALMRVRERKDRAMEAKNGNVIAVIYEPDKGVLLAEAAASAVLLAATHRVNVKFKFNSTWFEVNYKSLVEHCISGYGATEEQT